MDPTTNDILSRMGVQAAKELITSIIRYWEQRKKKKLSVAEKKEIADAAQEMLIQAATFEDVKEFSPAYHALRHGKRSAAIARKPRRKLVRSSVLAKRVAKKQARKKRG